MSSASSERETGYRGMVAWQRAMDLTVEIYGTTRAFPDIERFGLISQMQRAAASIPANIAKGYGRGSDADFSRFLSIAYGSLCELETFLNPHFDSSTLTKGREIDFSNAVPPQPACSMA